METDSSTSKQEGQFTPVLLKKRWFMLLLFASVSMLNAFQWLHINILADSAEAFWNESLPDGTANEQVAIAWLSMVYMLVYIPMIFPATWILNRYGLRVSIFIGAALNVIGAWMKCLSVEIAQRSGGVPTLASSSSFPVLMLAQTICAISQTFLLGVPAQLAATWFGQSELALATAIGVFGNQVGVALGFGLPPLIVPGVVDGVNTDKHFNELKRGFEILVFSGAAIITLDLIIVLIFFKGAPPVAPSLAQHKRLLQRQGQSPQGGHGDDAESTSKSQVDTTTETNDFKVQPGRWHQLKRIGRHLLSPSFIELNICYGVNTGVFYEVGTLLNVILEEKFPSEGVAIGWAGFTMVIAGLIGSIVAGIILKKTSLYRRVLIIFYLLSVISMAAFTGSTFSGSMIVVFVTMFSLGFFQSGFLPLGFEYAAEITYPVDEGLSSGILNTSAHVFGIILIYVATTLKVNYGGLSANLFMLVSMVVAGIPALFMRDDLKRQQAQLQIINGLEGDFEVEEGEEGVAYEQV